MSKTQDKSGFTGIKKQALNIGIVAVLTAIVFSVILLNNKDFSFKEFFKYIKSLNIFYVGGALGCMLLFIFFEGLSLKLILKKLGYKSKFREAMIYSTSDIYYSAITPSATGGQPASVYYMNKAGVPVSAATAAVTFNIFMYTASIMIIAAFAFLTKPSFFLNFDLIYKILIIAGVIVQSAILLFFLLLMKKPSVLRTLAKIAFTFLYKIKIVKNIEKKLEAIDNTIDSYKNCISIIGHNIPLALESLVLNFLQRVSQMAIAVFIYFAAGLKGISVVEIFVLQSFCLIGANSVPIPGAAGVSEGLYLNAFKPFFEKTMLLNCMMATRGIAYYISFIFSGILTFIHHIFITLSSEAKQQRG